MRLNDTVVELQKMFGHDMPKQTNPRVFIWRYGADLIAKTQFLVLELDAKGELSVALESCDAMFWNGERNVLFRIKLQFSQSVYANLGRSSILVFNFTVYNDTPVKEPTHFFNICWTNIYWLYNRKHV